MFDYYTGELKTPPKKRAVATRKMGPNHLGLKFRLRLRGVVRMAKMVPQYYSPDEVPRWKRGFGNHLQTGREVYLTTSSSEVISPDLGVEPKIEGFYPPQNGWFIYNGKPYEQMDDLGGVKTHPYFWRATHFGATVISRELTGPPP